MAARRFAKDEVIERNPVIVIPAQDWPHISETIVAKYCFVWRDAKEESAVALGLGSLFNHSYRPNVTAHTDVPGRAIEFLAARDIDEGEELTINYNAGRETPEPLGFRSYDRPR